MIKFGYPVKTQKELNGGEQYIFQFPNGYGASVVRHSFSYGGTKGLWELAVIEMGKEGKIKQIIYDTPVTNDVLGYLTEEKIEKILKQIEKLPKISFKEISK